jgi:hypothetical protein
MIVPTHPPEAANSPIEVGLMRALTIDAPVAQNAIDEEGAAWLFASCERRTR